MIIDFDSDLLGDLIYKSKSRKPSLNEEDGWGNLDSAAGWDFDEVDTF